MKMKRRFEEGERWRGAKGRERRMVGFDSADDEATFTEVRAVVE